MATTVDKRKKKWLVFMDTNTYKPKDNCIDKL